MTFKNKILHEVFRVHKQKKNRERERKSEREIERKREKRKIFSLICQENWIQYRPGKYSKFRQSGKYWEI